jgi:elongation factor P
MGQTIDTSEFKKGLKIEIDGSPWSIVDFQHVKPGKGSAFVRTRIKNLLTNNTIDRTFRSGDKVELAECEEIEASFMYNDGGSFHFMNQETFESFEVPPEAVGDNKNFLTENLKVGILFFKGKAIAIDLPNFIVAKITFCEPGVAGNTAQGATKLVTIETGYNVQVPLYIAETDVLKIDTRDGHYVERMNK